jgi:hypothetical protein
MGDDDEPADSDEEEQAGGQTRFAQAPNVEKGLRACKKCRLVKTMKQVGDAMCDERLAHGC